MKKFYTIIKTDNMAQITVDQFNKLRTRVASMKAAEISAKIEQINALLDTTIGSARSSVTYSKRHPEEVALSDASMKQLTALLSDAKDLKRQLSFLAEQSSFMDLLFATQEDETNEDNNSTVDDVPADEEPDRPADLGSY